MNEERALELASKSIGVAGEIKLTTQEFVSYQMAVKEEQMEKEVASLQTEVDQINKKITDISESIEKEWKLLVDETYGPRISEINSILKTIAVKFEPISVKHCISDNNVCDVEIEMTSSGGYQRDLCDLKPIKANGKILNLISERSAYQKDSNKLYDRITKINAALTQVDKMQRQATRRIIDKLANSDLKKKLGEMSK